MPDTVDTAATLLAAAAQEGPGDTLRIVLLVSIVGGALLAWFLLRGYRTDDSGDAGTGDGAAGGTGDGPDGNTDRDASA
ncbi:ABC-type microcin C transport system permease subunit YejB [Streptomyces sp. PvR006]|uniref:hypothetical protein n=1 Tax=unclassified Streptomyces TaxID=2593676 RepID=UPI001AEB4EBE|nr:hypothetical protein [Streptomyces sp. PvR006]MBP2582139.1 ABC-type microcin C transport system permease subunit YejB [Streptomyces sp. PvR006]